jgi:hypothetical protein
MAKNETKTKIDFMFIILNVVLQECLFNAVACFLYFSASSYMGVAVNIYLYPKYALVSMYSAYPAMTAVYVSII